MRKYSVPRIKFGTYQLKGIVSDIWDTWIEDFPTNTLNGFGYAMGVRWNIG